MEYNEVLKRVTKKICDITNEMPQYAPEEYNYLKSFIVEKLGDDYDSFIGKYSENKNIALQQHELILSCGQIYRTHSHLLYGNKGPCIKSYNNATAYRKLLQDESYTDNKADLMHKLSPYATQIGDLWDKALKQLVAKNHPITTSPPLLIVAEKHRMGNGWLLFILAIAYGVIVNALSFAGIRLGAIPTIILWGSMLLLYKLVKEKPTYKYSIKE